MVLCLFNHGCHDAGTGIGNGTIEIIKVLWGTKYMEYRPSICQVVVAGTATQISY